MTTTRGSSSELPSTRRRLVARAVVDDDELEIAHRLARGCCAPKAEKRRRVAGREDHRHERLRLAAHHELGRGRAMPLAYARWRTPTSRPSLSLSRPSTAATSLRILLDSLERQTYRTSACSSSIRTTTTGVVPILAASPDLEIERLYALTRALARAQRRAPTRRGRHRRVPRRRLRVPGRSARAGRRSASPTAPISTASPAAPPTRTAAARVSWSTGRRAAGARHRVESRELRLDASCVASSWSGSARSTSSSGSARATRWSSGEEIDYLVRALDSVRGSSSTRA